MPGKMPGWPEVSKSIGFILLFGVIAFRLYYGAGIISAIVWGGVVFFVFNIIVILITNIMVKIIHDYELRRMIELAEAEEEEEDEEFLREESTE